MRCTIPAGYHRRVPRPNHDTELPGYDAALQRVLAMVPTLDAEPVPLTEAAGRVLRSAVRADRDLPPFNRATMDGFALCAASYQAGRDYTVVGESPAGHETPIATADIDPATHALRIATGAPVPAPFDTVIPVERSTALDGDRVRFDAKSLQPGHAIHPRAADANAGDELTAPGTTLGPHHAGIAAAVGAGAGGAAGTAPLHVTRRPRIVILSSGDEVMPADTATNQLAPQQIRNSNGPMLAALLPRLGGHVLRHEHVRDETDETHTVAGRALLDADLVVTTGGVSVGPRDLFPDLWPTLGCNTLLHGVALQPGRPLLVTQHTDTNTLVAGLPGNPVSALVTALLFVAPILRAMLGQTAALPWRRAPLSAAVQPNARREAFRFARFVGDIAEQIKILPWHGSGDLAHTATADAIVRLPMQSEELAPGTPLRFLPLPT